MTKVINIGLLGLGTVGNGVLNILHNMLPEIERRLGSEIKLKHIAVRNLNRHKSINLKGIVLTNQAIEVIENPEIDIIVEVIGGTTTSKLLLEQAIHNGKDIVTANKALIAEHGNELFALAEKHGVNIFYEASVAGGIPIIKALREGLAANNIEWIAGIINGTGNYILTEMHKPDTDFKSVLKKAQKLGYAETDPTFDVEGIDAAHKLTILASISFGIPLNFSKVYTEGISKISADDIKFAQQMGYEIKHLGIAFRTEDGISLRVHPTLVPKKVLLSQVNSVMNAVMVYGSYVGTTMYYGAGAGGNATASAVVADIIDCAKARNNKIKIAPLGFNHLSKLKYTPIEEIEISAYLRFLTKEDSNILANIFYVLDSHGISIKKSHKESCKIKVQDATMVILTDKVKESNLNAAIKELYLLPEIDGEIMRIRIEDLE